MSTALNTLFITQDGTFLRKDHETIVVEVDGKKRLQMPFLHLSSVICLGRTMATPDLMNALTANGAHIAFLDYRGRFLARVEGAPGGNVLLRRTQYRTADDEPRCLEISRSIVAGKLANARQFLLHAARDARTEASQKELQSAAVRLRRHLYGVGKGETVDVVRGIEGIGARDYFAVFSHLIKKNEEAFAFEKRTRRPPLDRTNSMLSFGYVLLYQDCIAACAGIGLDPAVGYLHADRPGRLSLALDLMEELRAPVVDRLVVALINRGQVGPGDFFTEPTGAWRMSDTARKKFLVAYQEQKKEQVHHPLLQRRVAWGQIPHLQAQLLARHLRGDLDVYPPFTIR